MPSPAANMDFLTRHHPFDLLPPESLESLAAEVQTLSLAAEDVAYTPGDQVKALYVVQDGVVDLYTAEGEQISRFGPGENFGARPLLRGGTATHRTVASEATQLLMIPAEVFFRLLQDSDGFDHYFNYAREVDQRHQGLVQHADDGMISATLADLMTVNPIVVPADISVRQAATTMREHNISCVLVGTEQHLQGILTTGDLTGKVVAAGLDPDTPVHQVMTANPASLPPEALLFDAMLLMGEGKFGHLPICEDGQPVGILTRTNLIRQQSVSAVYMIGDIGKLREIPALAGVIQKVPQLLAQLVGAGVDAHKVAHVITSITDALTRRLLHLAEEQLGAPPVPYLWLACGSQGRQEQTGASDQDNCLILDDRYDEQAHGEYFKALAKFVCDGLDTTGYFYCPGEMMANNPRWCQPLRVWRQYFQGWVNKPDPMAQMLASVMFDLRPIAGETQLFDGLQRETLALARKNSIFQAHMTSNSLLHTPPLGLFRGFSLIRSGEHKNTLDLKHSGIVPIVDLARLYALRGAIEAVNTRQRLSDGRDAGTISKTGANDLIDAYDLIANLRLEHQARQIREGNKPDNYMAPGKLSALEQNYLKDAFGVVKTLQSAIGSRSFN